MHQLTRFIPVLPVGLEGLLDLALDVRWSWSHSSDRIWEAIDPVLWQKTQNAWFLLTRSSPARLQELARERSFLQAIAEELVLKEAYEKRIGWYANHAGADPIKSVAYFSMEFGLTEALPIYSGGLGMLAGDFLKAASDFQLPVCGVGLFYQQGYFRQVLSDDGLQLAQFPFNDPSQLPVVPVRDRDGEWLNVKIGFLGRTLHLRPWKVRVGRVWLYLLDSNDPLNHPADRAITGQLYGGSTELRLQQEIVLGIGGYRLLETMGQIPQIVHLNEGHAAFAILERCRCWLIRNQEKDFSLALLAQRPGTVFTTHTPVAYGFDRFDQALMTRYFGNYAEELGIDLDTVMALGRLDASSTQEPLNMAYLALRGSMWTNAVSRLHTKVSRSIFAPLFPRRPLAEVPVITVTNGVHMPSWDSALADDLWTTACGKDRWLGTGEQLPQAMGAVSSESLWAFRTASRERLVRAVHDRLTDGAGFAVPCSMDPEQARLAFHADVLTVGFARRFTTYKRPTLLLHDQERLAALLRNPQRPVQLVVAGKAHPQDSQGALTIQSWARFCQRQDIHGRAVFLADYDMLLASDLVQGVDVWLNTPLRPWEACGTSGMKVLVNGGINLSVLDGWWDEVYEEGVGFAVASSGDDAQDADAIYRLLEQEVVPAFYERDQAGIPQRFTGLMRRSMAELTPRMHAGRMVRDYVTEIYTKSQQAIAQRGIQQAREQHETLRLLQARFPGIRFGEITWQESDSGWKVGCAVYLGDVDPSWVAVELYADPLPGSEQPFLAPLGNTGPLPGSINGFYYEAAIPWGRPAEDHTLRVVPALSGVRVPQECNLILWQR